MFWIIVEIIAGITGIIYVYFQAKQTRRMWRWLIVASLMYGIVYIHKGFLSLALIQVYYIISAVYGIIRWSKVINAAIDQYGYQDPSVRKSVAIVRPNAKKMLLSSVIALAVFAVMSVISMKSFTPSPGEIPGKPYWDAGIAVLSMLATYWLTQAYFAQWIIWFVVNISGVIVFLYPVFNGHAENAIIPIGITYLIYIVTCTYGAINWKRNGVIVENV